MSSEVTFLSIDLGAESGRTFLGSFDGEHVELTEVYRFPNGPVQIIDGLHWDMLGIFGHIKRGLSKAAGKVGWLASVGVDSWAVDFALLDRNGALISNPYHHRDLHTEGMINRAFERVPKEKIYQTTGIQFIRINTLYQLLAQEDSPLLEVADKMLLIPDLINYWLTGEKVCELTNATTTQLLDIGTGDWSTELAGKLGIPAHIFPELVQPATELGPLLPWVGEETGLGSNVEITTVASHDTASAVAAVPTEGEDFAYISSGTWSLVGVEIPRPVVSREALEANFTNEGGFGGKTRFLKNVMGLWLLQECKRNWAREGRNYSYEELEALARSAPAFGPLVEPDYPDFLHPGDILWRIRDFCEKTGQSTPREPGEVVRCVFESLALKYARVIEQASGIAGQRVNRIYVVGGGCQNRLLCQLTANATGLAVIAGPVEATVLGNLLVQAYAGGYVGSLEEVRRAVRRSVHMETYKPRGSDRDWDGARERFSLLQRARTLEDTRGG